MICRKCKLPTEYNKIGCCVKCIYEAYAQVLNRPFTDGEAELRFMEFVAK